MRLTSLRLKRFIDGCSILVVALTLTSLGGIFHEPRKLKEDSAFEAPAQSKSVIATSDKTALSLRELRELAPRLRRPLYDAPTDSSEPAPPSPPRFPGELIGTLVDEDVSMVVLSGIAEDLTVAALGDPILVGDTEAKVIEIAYDFVRIEFNDSIVSLHLKTP